MLYQEATALWRQLHDAPPPCGADASMILEWIITGLPPAEYNRLVTPHLRPSAITFPKA